MVGGGVGAVEGVVVGGVEEVEGGGVAAGGVPEGVGLVVGWLGLVVVLEGWWRARRWEMSVYLRPLG